MAEKITKEDLHLDWADAGRRSSSGWCGWAGPGRRSAASGCSVLEAGGGRDGDGRRRGGRPAALDGPTVATGDGTLVLRRVQPESRSPMSADEWLRGVRPAVGERLGTD